MNILSKWHAYLIYTDRHLALECKVSKHRRQLISDAQKRKQQEEQRILNESEAKKRLQLQLLLEQEQAALAAAASALLHLGDDDDSNWNGISKPGRTTTNPEEAVATTTEQCTTENHFKLCPQCQESLRVSQIPLHLKELCSRRKVMCPNFYLGCEDKFVPLHLLQEHLHNGCKAEVLRDQMIARSEARRGLVYTLYYYRYVAVFGNNINNYIDSEMMLYMKLIYTNISVLVIQ